MNNTTEKNLGDFNLEDFDLVTIVDIKSNTEIVETYDIEVAEKNYFYISNPQNKLNTFIVSHNSAEIALGDPDDILYLRAKNWSGGNIPNWRDKSNNTIYADEYDHIMSEVWENGYIVDRETGYAKGEPYGFFNLPLSSKYGRIKDGPIKDNKMYPTNIDNCEMTNPCAEISLANYECCNLCELYLNNIESKEELIEAAKLLYKTQKAIAALPFIHDETNKVVHKNMRLGLGVTGVCQALDKIEWLDDCYIALRKFDKQWSKEKGYVESIKLTTVKPSGCVIPITKIKTDKGILSFEELFKMNNINLNEKLNEYRKWYDTIINIHVLDKNGDYKKINKLFINGYEQTIKLTFDDGFMIECTPNHKFLLKSGEWKQARDLTEFDEFDETFYKKPKKIDGFSVKRLKRRYYMKLIKKEISENFTVDCEIEDTHCYQLENGIVSHNTLSLLAGATPGVHPAYSKYYMRTVRIASNDRLVQICKDLGYHTEFLLNFDGTENRETNVVYFPCETPDNTITVKDMSVLKQLEMVRKLQDVWSDNAISVTAYYYESELNDLKEWLKKNYKNCIKSVSFLLHQKHGFKQAPYQEIDKDTYEKAKSKVKPLINAKILNGEIIQGLECEGGACPIR